MKQVWVTDVPRPSGSDIIVVKLLDGGVSSRWLAQRVVNAIRGKIPLSEMDRDVVILNSGVASDALRVIGTSPAAERYLSAVLPKSKTIRGERCNSPGKSRALRVAWIADERLHHITIVVMTANGRIARPR